MYKKIRSAILLMLCVLMVMTSCNKQNQANQIIDDKDVNTISFDRSYELVALKTDNQGIELSSAFQLSSKEDIDNNFIKNNLQIIPKTDYKIKKLSNTSYNIIPASNLENNKVYQVKLDSPKGLYSWAFQTKKQFSLDSTIPSNESNYVPERSGIEMYFNMTNLDSIDKYFTIYPQVEGDFKYNNNSVIFVPTNPLAQGKKYTVTIKKGFGLKNSEEKLLNDYIFTFTVERSSEQAFVGDDLVNIFEDNTKVFKGYFGKNYKEKEFTIDIYKFINSDAFCNSYQEYLKVNDFNQNLEDSSVLTKVNTIYQKPYMLESSYSNEGIFELPKELAKGHYLINISLKDDTSFNSYQYLQINDMMMYNAIFQDKILIYAIDGKSSEGISGAEVYLNDKKLGTTKDDGVLLENIDSEIFKGSLHLVKLKAKGYNDFIYAQELYYRDNYYNYYNNDSYKYFSYIYTDRDVYLPTDTINLWGYARLKDDSKVDELKLELVEPNTGMVIETKYVKPNDIGTYQVNFSLNNWTYYYCSIRVYHNDVLVNYEYLDVKEYTKPLYYIESEFDKEFVYSDETLKLKINAKFFDGYPVKGIGVNYGSYTYNFGNSYHKSTVLDDKGESIVDIDTNVKSTNWRPNTITIYSTNEEAEETTIRNYNTFTVFPKHQMLEIDHDNNNMEYFSILIHELDNSLYGSEMYKDTSDLRGEGLNGSVKLEIHEIYYEKKISGERYDFINKQKVVDYTYDRIENIVYNEMVSINNGSSDNIKIPNLNKDRYYEIIASYDDGKGGIIEKTYVGFAYQPYNSDRNYYTLDTLDNKKYRLNDDINISLFHNDSIAENVDGDKLLVLTMNNGLINYKLYDETTFKDVFKEEYVPNVILNGVYIKNGYIYPIEYNQYVYYDYKERKIYFDVYTDKEEYRPGDEVVLKVKAYDENKNPIIADLNISVVDEAYFSIFPQSVDILSEFYDYVYYTGLISTYLSNVEIELREDSEKGGGGDGFGDAIRDDFKDTNIFETVRTDKDGNAELKFKLADNITSWRITYQAISEEKYAGNGKKNITTTLPFYIDMIMYDKYLIDDNIGVSLRIFGQEAINGGNVNYKIVVKNKDTNKEEEYNKAGIIGEYTNINIGKKEEGTYEIYVYASSASYKDAIKEEFKVVESYVYFNNVVEHKLTEATALDKVYSNPVITLYNNSKSDFFNSLWEITSNGGRRIDQIVCSLISTKYINSYFDLNWDYSENELISLLNDYEGEINNSVGYKLLPYSDVDAEVTAKLVHSIDIDIIDAKAKQYFTYLLQDKEYSIKTAAALWGAAKYKEPILLQLYELLEKQDLPLRDKLYLCLALVDLGDYKTAEKYYKDILEKNIKIEAAYLYIVNNIDTTAISEADNYELTALASILAVQLKDFENGDKLFKYIYKNPSMYTLSNFEQLIYIMNRDILSTDEVKDLFGEVTVTIGDKKQDYKLKLFDRVIFPIKKEDVEKVKFSNIKGDIKCVLEALGNKDDLQKNKSDNFKIDVSYLNGTDQSKATYNQSDVVKVTIMPSISNYVEYGRYEITYILPSGFRFVKSEVNYYNGLYWETSSDDQKLSYQFSYERDRTILKPIVIYMQAAQSGEYTVDFAVIKDLYSSKLNYVEKFKLIIE